MVNLNFNANEVEPKLAFDPIPAGKYLALIINSEMKPTKTANGKFLELTFQIIDGPFKNRQVWSRLNLQNPSQQAVQIAQSELSAICRAVGVMTPNDSVELHNLPLVITVRCKKRSDTDELTNEIKGYAKREVGVTVAAAASPTSNAQAPAPWKRS